MCLRAGRGAKDVGLSKCRVASPLSEMKGEVSAAGDSDGVAEAALCRQWY